MDWQETLENARGNMGFCKVCAVCDGRVCKNTIPGPGAKGRGDVAIRNYAAWQDIRINLDTLHANVPVDTQATLFGKTFAIPVFAGPVGAVKLHYGDKYTDTEYNDILVPACADAGIAAMVGDGVDPMVIQAGTDAIKRSAGVGIPTVKPWDIETVRQKMQLAQDCGAFAIAMDVDAAGLPFLQNRQPPAGSKSVDELREIADLVDAPFIVKGIMTPRAAAKAAEAGAAGIVVSNHGGRVLDGTPSTAEVLPSIAREVGGDLTILVDGGIRTGLDVFKALALGADGVIIARPFVTAVYGGQAEGVAALVARLQAELADAMRMTGAAKIADIDGEFIWE
ncbi:MAG: alpha-hydroxy-acid oxidizing protein [Coriobacteriaceae bacterium]|nr:alpha-hydroxy-acid oxidizing protein [Coriobacteriaceae bacterium]